MRFFLSFCIIFLLGQDSFTQTITSSNTPVPGDIFIQTDMDPSSVWEGLPGIQTWDFSSIAPDTNTEVDSFYFKSPSSTIFGTEFPESNLAAQRRWTYPPNIADYYYYFITSPDSLIQTGEARAFFELHYDTPVVLMKYPFVYGDSLSAPYNGEYIYFSEHRFRWGSNTVKADGKGTLILPAGTFNDVLRVKYIRTEIDSFEAGFKTEKLFTEYKWYKDGYKFPLFEILYEESGGFEVKYAKLNNELTTGIINYSTLSPTHSKLYQNYPNPFNPETKIKFDIKRSGLVTLKVYDILGNEIETLISNNLNLGSYEFTWSPGHYPSGVYYYKLESNGVSFVKKMVLIK
jgi:hypothetical protein